MRDTTPDIVTRLRECAAQCDHPTSLLYDLAADEIERLQKREMHLLGVIRDYNSDDALFDHEKGRGVVRWGY
jgi:hypothetical protein